MSIFRPNIDQMAGYVPGEQPQQPGWIKLNTNENPYPPSPRVVDAIREAAESRLNLYPDPLGTRFREAAALLFNVEPDWILPANGSDENLTIITRACGGTDDLLVYPYPSYILYETLAELQGTRHARLQLTEDFGWDHAAMRHFIQQARLAFIPNPNSPSGTRWSDEDLLRLIPPDGMLVLDEAYGDFADHPHRAELLRSPEGARIIITRTLSKSYSLAGIRFGFAIAHPDVIEQLRKVKDSYNCDAIALAAATAAITDQAWMHANTAKIRATRARLAAGLAALGFVVTPSQANFVWCRHPSGRHQPIYAALKERQILIRYMKFPEVTWATDGLFDGLRMTVGTDAEIDTLLDQLRQLV